MFRLKYCDMWEALNRMRDRQGFKAYRNALRRILEVASFDNRYLYLPNYLIIKR